MSRLDAKEQMQAMDLDRENALHHPERGDEHDKAKAEFYRLQAIVYGLDSAPGHTRR